MSLISDIFAKLGLKKPVAVATKVPPVTQIGKAPSGAPNVRPVAAQPFPASYGAGKPAAAPAPVAMEAVDVVAKLEKLAKANPAKLDWKVSIVDLLKLLELDSSLTARKTLATELGCPPAKMTGDYAEMNIWLHKTVLQKIAENGGNIPQSLL
jgi:hypothetical protein